MRQVKDEVPIWSTPTLIGPADQLSLTTFHRKQTFT